MNRHQITIGIALLAACFSFGAPIAIANDDSAPAGNSRFLWPEANPNALPDARLHDLVEKARNEAAQARQMAKEAGAFAIRLQNKMKWDRYQPEIISDGVTFTGHFAPEASAAGLEIYVGKMRYSYGAEITGSFTFIRYPEHSTWGYGIVTPLGVSLLESFKGQVAEPSDIRSRPAQGIATYKSGDKFIGLYYLYFGDTDAVGVYEDAKGSRRFVGQVKTVDGMLQPKKGVVEDSSGRLLAVIQ